MKAELSAFLRYLRLEKRYSEHTLQAYETDLNQVEAYLQDVYDLDSWGRVEGWHLRSWLAEQMSNELAASTVRRKISSIRTFYRFLEKRFDIPAQVAKVLLFPKLPKRLPTTIREKDLTQLFEEVVFPEGYQGLLEKTVIELLYATGMRRSEILQLQLKDLDFERKDIRVKGKGNKERLIPMTPSVETLLNLYLEARLSQIKTDVADLFVTEKGRPLYPKRIYDIVKKYLSLVSSEKKRSPHVLRHSFATHLMDAGADLNAVKELLGHSSLAATQVYTHNTIEKLKRSYMQAHPKAKKED